jgi:uncharacterized protein with NRDE domain
MCLPVCSWDPEASPSLVIAANRDEYLDRPSQTAHFWSKEWGKDKNNNNNNSNRAHPTVYGPRDLKMGGTWLACSTTGRFATITNYYVTSDMKVEDEVMDTNPRKNATKPTTAAKRTTESASVRRRRPSKFRGSIPVTFLESPLSAMDFTKTIEQESPMEYAGFCAILFDGTSLIYCSNRGATTTTLATTSTITHSYAPEEEEEEYQFVYQELTPGIYGLSNHLLDTPWPRLVRSKQAVAKLLAAFTPKAAVAAAASALCHWCGRVN